MYIKPFSGRGSARTPTGEHTALPQDPSWRGGGWLPLPKNPSLLSDLWASGVDPAPDAKQKDCPPPNKTDWMRRCGSNVAINSNQQHNVLRSDLQNILRQSYDYLTIMPKMRSTYDERLI